MRTTCVVFPPQKKILCVLNICLKQRQRESLCALAAKMGDHIMLDLDEWALVLSKMLRFHFNISEDIKKIVQTIRVEMKPELIPLAEEKSNFGKVVKKAIR